MVHAVDIIFSVAHTKVGLEKRGTLFCAVDLPRWITLHVLSCESTAAADCYMTEVNS